MLSNGGMFKGNVDDLIETIPRFARRELDARPYVAYTYTPKQFIWENVEKGGFIVDLPPDHGGKCEQAKAHGHNDRSDGSVGGGECGLGQGHVL